MLITKYNIFIFILMFYSIIPQNDICNYDNDCSCKICGENTHNYKTCNYINLFCENGDNVLTTRYSTFKIYYIDYFVKGIDYENFCGELKQPIKDEEIETIIIKTGQSYTKGTRVHCHYSVYYNNYKEYNPIMTYQISQNGNNKLKFNLIVVYHIPNLVYTELFTDDDIRKSAFEDNVADFDLVELFLDFKEINDELTDVSTKAIFYSAITNPLTRFINSLVYASVALYGAFNVIALNMTVGNLTSILMYANQYTKPFNEISSVITEMQNAFACAERVFELINRKERVPEKEDAVELTNVSGNVEFKNVSFSYNKETKLIENFNINIKPGMRVAIVGPTGCGKTTVINLLMRFYDTDKGGIYVDGIDTRDITRNSLRRNFGMVLQETWLRSGTVRDNIAIGREDATEEEIIAASKAAHAHSFIKKLEKGYDTVLSEDGGSLSAGQKQLICIARLFLALPPMLILDEATSSIDTRTELKIQNAFAKLMKGRTSFIVAHRLSTIKEADLILVMNKGNIVETGSDEELTQKKGFYYNLKTAVEK